MTHSEQLECPVVADEPSTTRQSPDLIPTFLTTPVPTEKRSKSSLVRWSVAGILVAGVSWGGWVAAHSKKWRGNDPIQLLPKSTVSRVDLSTVLSAFGRVESSAKTIITCELERLEIRNAGRSISSGGASTILSLIDEGTEVKKDDILCRLDSSEYEELVYTQDLKTQQATAALEQAKLNFEVAEITVREYREGLAKQTIQSYEGSIALAKADQERAVDRLAWTRKMLTKGYASVATQANAVRDLYQSTFDLETSSLGLKNYRSFGNEKTMMELLSEVEKRRFEVIANTQRVTRNTAQLAHYKLMVEKCTIRAPHDGFLIYASDPNRPGAAPIEPGLTVRQSQKLFFLPDLGKMEVLAYIHESVASRVHEGMRATTRIEGLSNRTLEGHVVSVAPLPTTGGNWISDEVKYFVSVVKLDSVPKGIRPGMSAEIEFDVERCLDVLAVPTEAVAIEKGHNVCYVSGVDGLERRPVTLGRSSRNLLEVTKGLVEGDQVILRPDHVESIDSLVVHSDPSLSERESPDFDAPASTASPVTVE